LNLKVTVPAVILAGGILLCSTATYGKAEYTKKEKKACTFCHTAANSKELNDAGKYYQEHKSLDGYKK
jgi:hypothetical protein